MEQVMRSNRELIGSATSNWENLRAAKNEMAHTLIHKARAIEVEREDPLSSAAARWLLPPVNPIPSENIMGVGIGEKVSDGKQTGILAVKFLVRMKFAKSDLTTKHLLPKEIGGIPTDVEEVGIFRRFTPSSAPRVRQQTATMPNPKVKLRPAQPGCSIGFQVPGNQFTMAGTFGALVRDDEGIYVLSNNHVLADENRLSVGAPIFQPGLLDGGNSKTGQIAALTRFVTLQSASKNAVDCAIAEVLSEDAMSKDILHIGPPQGTESAALDMTVHKFGRTTGYSVGQVTSIDTDVTVQYDLGNLTFTEQIIVVGNGATPFSNAGDSGSLILERATNKAIGLLFAGSGSHTIANHIDEVLSQLAVTLA
jgi:hypothetical protein